TAGPVLQRAELVGGVQRPVVGDVRGARAEESADHHGDREGIHALVPDQVPRAADRDETARDPAEEREERVPGDAERSDEEVGVEGEVDQATTVSVRRTAVERRTIIGSAADSTSTAMS